MASSFRQVILISAGALILASGGATARARSIAQAPASPDALPASPRKIWTATGDLTYGSISPDAHFVTFVRSDQDQSALFVRDLVKGTDIRLTATDLKGIPGRAVFSPDSKRVAFNWTNAGLDEIRVIELNDDTPGAPHVIVPPRQEMPTIWPGDWSPDGKSIAAVVFKPDRRGAIALIAVADGSIRELKSADFGRLWSFDASHLRFSPDGRYVAFSQLDFATWCSAISLIAVDSGREVEAVAHPVDDQPAGWTRDGSRLLFLRKENGSLAVWAQRVDAGRPVGASELIASDFGPNHVYSFLGVSGDGRVFFSTAARELRITIAAFDSLSGKVSVRHELFGGVQPAWSPDGASLAFKNVGGPEDPSGHILTIASFAHGPDRVLRPRLLTWNWPQWSADLRSFVAHGTAQTGRQGIYRIDATTSEVQPIVLAQPGEGLGFPQLFGDRIVYTRRTSSGRRATAVVEWSLSSSQQRVIVEAPGISDEFILSPDGRFVAYIVRDGALKKTTIEVAPTSGGERRQLVSVVGDVSLGSWTPDSASIVYSRTATLTSESPTFETWLTPLSGSQSIKIQSPDGLAQLPRVSPDGKQIAFFIPNRSPEELWVIQSSQR